MQPDRISEAEFAAVLRKAGHRPDTAKLGELYAAYSHIEDMALRVRTEREIDAEPAHIFAPPTGAP